MTQKLHRESKITAIADAIRTKRGESSSTKYKVSDMATAIRGISGGGIDYTTTMTLTSDKESTTGAVTLYAKVNNTCTVSGLTPVGYLENATVSFYKVVSGVRTLLGTATTSNGIATYNTTITENTTFLAEYSDGTHYDTCNATKTITYITKETYEEDYTGTITDKYNIYRTGTISYTTSDGYNVVCGQTTNSSDFGAFPKFSKEITLDTDFTIECDWKFTNHWNGGGIVLFNNDTLTELFRFESRGTSCPLSYHTSTSTWNSLKLIQEDGVTTVYVNDTLVGSHTYTGDGNVGFFFGGDTSSFYYYLKNIKIEVY